MDPEVVATRLSPRVADWEGDAGSFLPAEEVVDLAASAQACAGLERRAWLALRWVVLADAGVGLELAGHLAVWLAGGRRPSVLERRIARVVVVEAATPGLGRRVDRDCVRRLAVGVSGRDWRSRVSRRYELGYGRLMDWSSEALHHVRRRVAA